MYLFLNCEDGPSDRRETVLTDLGKVERRLSIYGPIIFFGMNQVVGCQIQLGESFPQTK